MSKICNCLSKTKIKTGDKYGRLEVLRLSESKNGKVCFECRCDCGTVTTVRSVYLRSGHTKSCGCLQRERSTIHGMYGTPTYRTWLAMIQRCYNPNTLKYKYYGGRGITICQEWRDSFENFYADMGNRPIGSTIDRKNNELGYFLDNCRWASVVDQRRNRRVCAKNKTGVKGIYWNKNYKKYHVRITADSKSFHIGYFKDLEQAKSARIDAEHRYWGGNVSVKKL